MKTIIDVNVKDLDATVKDHINYIKKEMTKLKNTLARKEDTITAQEAKIKELRRQLNLRNEVYDAIQELGEMIREMKGDKEPL